MATAILPIVATLTPLVTPWIVKLVDKVFPSKSGPQKLIAATTAVTAFVNGLAQLQQSGQLTAADVQPLVQKVVDALQAAGELKGADTVIPAPTIAPASPPGQPAPDARPAPPQGGSGVPSWSMVASVADARKMLGILSEIAPVLGVKS
jgi:hypothetical protein